MVTPGELHTATDGVMIVNKSSDYLDVTGTKRLVSETVGNKEVWIR